MLYVYYHKQKSHASPDCYRGSTICLANRENIVFLWITL